MADSESKTQAGLPPLKVAENKQLTEKEIREIKEYTDLFRKIDLDGDGVISKEDFRTAIKKYGFQATEVIQLANNIFTNYFMLCWGCNNSKDNFLIKKHLPSPELNHNKLYVRLL
jgi:hypothetical protein